jgi:hypothetical protein
VLRSSVFHLAGQAAPNVCDVASSGFARRRACGPLQRRRGIGPRLGAPSLPWKSRECCWTAPPAAALAGRETAE